MRWLCAALLSALGAPQANAATGTCSALPSVPLRVQIGSTPFIAHLSAAADPLQLQLLQAGSGQRLWSAGAGPGASQHIFDSTARFSSSLSVIDTDSDGLHDRIYAGDLSGRLWRIDLDNGGQAGAFASATVLADLGDNTGSRRLVAPADVWRAQTGQGSHLRIAIGTAGPGNANRFHLLRDADPASATQMTNIVQVPADHHVELGAAQVLAASITVHGRTTLAVAHDANPFTCMADISVATFESVASDSPPAATPPAWQQHGSLPSGAGFRISIEEAGTRLQCRLAGIAIPACSTPVPVLDRFWRREDAD